MGILVTDFNTSKLVTQDDFVRAVQDIKEENIVGYTSSVKYIDNIEELKAVAEEVLRMGNTNI